MKRTFSGLLFFVAVSCLSGCLKKKKQVYQEVVQESSGLIIPSVYKRSQAVDSEPTDLSALKTESSQEKPLAVGEWFKRCEALCSDIWFPLGAVPQSYVQTDQEWQVELRVARSWQEMCQEYITQMDRYGWLILGNVCFSEHAVFLFKMGKRLCLVNIKKESKWLGPPGVVVMLTLFAATTT